MNKKITFTIVILILFSTQIKAQKIVENKIDEFTNNKIKRTSWISTYTREYRTRFRISKINDNLYLNLKMANGNVFSINEGQKLMLKLSNGEIIKLHNIEYEITCTGCAAIGFVGSQAQGISVSYGMTQKEMTQIGNQDILKIRIYTTTGYVEDDLKLKYSKRIKKAISLFEN
jgi:hypothetical protein